MFRFRSHVAFSALVFGALFNLISDARPSSSLISQVRVGIDVLEEQHFAPLQGRRVGLITNRTGVDRSGRRTIDVIAHAPRTTLVALFSPEHGLGAVAEGAVGDRTDAATGLPIYSLYGQVRRPTDRMLNGIDVLVFDVQDAGVRFYTYVTTMGYCIEEAAKRHIEFVVVDRPDPLGGQVIEGPMLDADQASFTGYFPMPVRYGMTMGELAKMLNADKHLGADLHVVEMRGWRRREAYDETGLRWIPPSPNLRTIDEAFLYPGVEILQAGGVSVGRGTHTPFEILGAPWIRGDALAAALTGRAISGVSFVSTQFTPQESPYSGQLCNGVRMTITNRNAFRAMRLGLEIADALHRMYPEQFRLEKTITLLGSQSTIDRLKRGDAPADIVAGWSDDLDKFRELRENFLLYH